MLSLLPPNLRLTKVGCCFFCETVNYSIFENRVSPEILTFAIQNQTQYILKTKRKLVQINIFMPFLCLSLPSNSKGHII